MLFRIPPNLLAAVFAVVAISPQAALGGPTTDPIWTTEKDRNTERVQFRVSDAACAYEIIADPEKMTAGLPHVKSYKIHTSRPGYMDVSITEVFAKLAKGSSRYERRFDGKTRISWRLTAGRQKVHDGEWVVTPDQDGATVEFHNRIEAKQKFQQTLFRWVQKATMKDIVRATRKRCGEG